MGKLPSEADLGRRLYRASSPDVRVRAPDYAPIAKGVAAVADGVTALGKVQDELSDYETRKKLLDFKLETEMELEEAKREMTPGGAGFTQGWRDRFRKRAYDFVGKDDANIPESQRGKLGLWLKQHEVMLAERAQRYELLERDREHVDGLETQLGALRDVVGANPARREEMAGEGRRQIELSRIPAADKHRLTRKYEKELDKTQATARIYAIRSPQDMEALRNELRLDQEDVPEAGPAGSVRIEPRQDGLATVVSPRGAKLHVSGRHADRFAGLIEDLEAAGIEIKGDQSGGFAKRTIRGTSTPSRHSHGEAVDINWHENAEGQRGALAERLGEDKVREIARRNGLKWGGDFRGRSRDDMHFEVDGRLTPVPRQAVPATTFESEPSLSEAPDPRRSYRHLTLMERRTFWGQAQTRWKEIEKEMRAEAARAWVAGVLEGTIDFNPMSTDGRKLLDDMISQSAIGDRIFGGDLEAATQGVALAQRLRHAPKPIAEAIGGLARSADPAKKALALSAIWNISRQAPHALDHLPGHEQLAKDAEKFALYRDRYGGTGAALKRMAEDNDPEKQRARRAAAADADKFVKDELSEDKVRWAMSRGTVADWWSRPATPQDYERRNLMIGEFKEVARREFEATGDKDLAIALATHHFQKRHGISEFLGRKEIMAYPPERFWPPVGGSYAYMKQDLDKVVGTYGASADPKSVGLAFAGFGADGKPTYWVSWKRKDDGRLEMAPRPWVPGYAEADRLSDEEWRRRRDARVEWDETWRQVPGRSAPGSPTQRQIDSLRSGVPLELAP